MSEQAEAALELVKARYDRPPTIREIRRAVMTVRNRVFGFGPTDEWDDEGRTSPCVHCREPVLNGPDAASRYDQGRWINAHLSCADAAGVRR